MLTCLPDGLYAGTYEFENIVHEIGYVYAPVLSHPFLRSEHELNGKCENEPRLDVYIDSSLICHQKTAKSNFPYCPVLLLPHLTLHCVF